MTHEEFVRAYRAGEVGVRIWLPFAVRVWRRRGGDSDQLPAPPLRRRPFSLIFAGSILIGGFGSSWIRGLGGAIWNWVAWAVLAAALVTVAGAAVGATLAFQRATMRFMRKQALEDKGFYDLAQASGALTVTWRGMPVP